MLAFCIYKLLVWLLKDCEIIFPYKYQFIENSSYSFNCANVDILSYLD